MTSVTTALPVVMAGPDPAIQTPGAGGWMPGSSPDLIRGPVMPGVATVLPVVMAGLDPAIQTPGIGDWMPGSSPGMTRWRAAWPTVVVMVRLDPTNASTCPYTPFGPPGMRGFARSRSTFAPDFRTV